MKSIIDRKNKLWKWKKADKQTKDQYRKQTGLEAKEIGMMTDEGWNLYMSLFKEKRKKK